MKKRIVIISIILAILISLIAFYKWKQSSFLGLSEPQIETQQSIVDYAIKNKISGSVYVAKNANSFDTLTKYFDFGQIYVLDENFNLLDCNLETLGGQCFQDITDNICDNLNLKHRKLDKRISGTTIYERVVKNSNNLSTDIQQSKVKYTIIYPWVKYAKACIDENSLKFMNCVKNRNDVHIINLNLDNQEFN